MKRNPFASDSLLKLRVSACPTPSRCPYCLADAPRHWTRWGSYQRYGGDPKDPSQRIAIARYWCRLVRRTFSLLPDSLLPYCRVRTGFVLDWLHTLFTEGSGLNTLARYVGVARGTLRYLKVCFLRTLPKLRLPRHEGALAPVEFLSILADMGSAPIANLLRDWKESEPKHSIVGIYLRC